MLASLAVAAEAPSGADVARGLAQISVDSEQTYRVRELELRRGDIKIYLTEGILSFVKPVAGQRVAAVFTTEGVEAGDAEILVLPPQRSERASLASFINSPNLDEHFVSAIFLFSDNTEQELLSQIQARPVHKAEALGTELMPQLEPALRQVSAASEVQLVSAILDRHERSEGFFYALIGGRNLGRFDVLYQPTEFESVSIGRPTEGENGGTWELWTSFRPRGAPPHPQAVARLSDYRIDTTIRPDLSVTAVARFRMSARESDGRVIPLQLSDKLHLISAEIDGQAAEIFERDSGRWAAGLQHGRTFLLVLGAPLIAGTRHDVEVQYEGSVIRRAEDGSYFVDERNAWFPYSDPTRATFDLTFHTPANLRLVSTGEPLSDQVIKEQGVDQRVVHRKTQVAEALAGFNLGDYNVRAEDRGPYRIECYSNRSGFEGPETAAADIQNQAGDVLDYYTRRWTKLPIHDVAVTPIAGYFGQGFPGLIYLSSVSYVRKADRPPEIRGQQLDAFFSELLLPHEVAHQWWGNVVGTANYRAGWIVEAMADDAALEFLERKQPAEVRQMLNQYRQDLLRVRNGKTIESVGPVDFGTRLMQIADAATWHVIAYEKGAWILRMLRERLGAAGFHQMQMELLTEFAERPMTNEDLRKVAARFVPAGVPDQTLSLFFDTWVYGTGIPKMSLARAREGMTLRIADVEEDFTADVPLDCRTTDGKREVRWLRATSGDNDVQLRPGQAACALPDPNEFLYSR